MSRISICALYHGLIARLEVLICRHTCSICTEIHASIAEHDLASIAAIFPVDEHCKMLQCAEHGKPQMGTVGGGSVIRGSVLYATQQLKALLNLEGYTC